MCVNDFTSYISEVKEHPPRLGASSGKTAFKTAAYNGQNAYITTAYKKLG